MKIRMRLFSLMVALITGIAALGIVPVAYAEQIDYDNYDLLDWQPTYASYWYSLEEGEMAYTLHTGNNLYISSAVIFDREDLPQGTVIEVSEGYQYRPEGWITLSTQKTRPNNTSAQQVVVDNAWWGEFNYRAFNVSKTDGSAFSEMDVEQVRDAFRIYVPKKPGTITITDIDEENGTMNVSVENAEGIVLVASYDSDNAMKAVSTYTTDELAESPVVTFDAAAAYTNIYCWDNWENMKPVAQKVSTLDLIKKVTVSMNMDELKASTELTATLNDLDALYYEYQWLVSDDGVVFDKLLTQTEQKYYVSSQDKNKYIAVDVTPVYAGGQKGETLRSTDVLYVENLGNIRVDSPDAQTRFNTRYTPDENRFTIEGSTRPFVLLDYFDDENSAFYILSDFLTGTPAQHQTDPQAINPEDEGSVGYWLNNDFATGSYEIGGTTKEGLEPEIYKYIDKNHTWWVEAGLEGIDDDTTEDYSFTAGLGMMTQTEAIKYMDRFGWNVTSEHGNWTGNWQTATGSAETDQYVVVDDFNIESVENIYNAGEHQVVYMQSGEERDPTDLTQQFYVRPSFYLNRNFFKEVRLNVDAVGDNIKKMLKEQYTVEELEGIYSQEELTALGMFGSDTPDPGAPTEGLKVLAIGNSFSVDSMEYLYDIAKTLTDEDIVLGNMYIGGCTLNMHNTNAKTNATSYTYYKNTGNGWSESGGYTLQRGIMDEDWDIIMLQQASGSSGMQDTYNNDLTELVEYVKSKATNPDMRLGWNMTWAYQQDSDHVEFVNYNNDQMTMYNAITAAVQAKIATNSDFDFIIPTGTAVQNARTSYIGDNLTRDGYHLSLGMGRYIAALTWAGMITGNTSVDSVTWVPSVTTINSSYLEIAKESVNNAYASPYSVTESVFKTEPVEVNIVSDVSVGAGATLTATLNYEGAESYEYQWISSDNGSDFEELYAQNSDKYIITNQDKSKYINCRITPVMAGGEKAEPMQAKTAIYVENLGVIDAQSPSAEERFATKDTPAENQFTIEGSTRKYVLLDKFSDENSTFYVLSDFLTGNINSLSKDLTTPTEPGTLGYWLNNTYVKDGYEIAGMNMGPIEASIYEYVDKNHTWWVEAGIKDIDKTAEDYSYQAGIGLLTESETRKYRYVFGWNSTTEHGGWYNPWLLATASRATNNYITLMNYQVNDVETIGGSGEHPIIDFTSPSGEMYAKPAFYLSREFFKNVRLDLDSLGDNVKKAIRDTYTPDELSIYSAGELRSLGYIIADATIDSDMNPIGAKATLTASMGDAEAVSFNYQWMQSDSESGVYTDIKTAVSEQYYVTSQDKGKYIKCKITPVYKTGETGTSVISEPVFVENLGRVSVDYVDDTFLQETRSTPDEYKFSLPESQRVYSLLDEFNDTDSAYYVLADYLTNNVEYDSSDPAGLNPYAATNIAYWLNNAFVNSGYNLAGGDWPKLEEGIYAHVDKDHTWWVEAGVADAEDATAYEDYSYTAGIGLMTESESIKYRTKYGWNITTENGLWYHPYYLATGNSTTDKYVVVQNWEIGKDGVLSGAGQHNAEIITPGKHREIYARPAFYLDFDFFREVKLDLSRTGSAVIEILKTNYTEEELSAIYDYSELEMLGFSVPVSINQSEEYKNGEIYINLSYENTTSNPVSVEVRYTCGDVSDSYVYDGILWEGDTATESILVKTLPIGENTITVELLVDDEVIGTLVKTITVIE